MPKLTVLVGPPGSGKSTLANNRINNDGDHGAATVYINQDKQGAGHKGLFAAAIAERKDIIIDRMNFNIIQRKSYLDPAKTAGYETEIIVLHQPYDTCLERIRARVGHETIKDEKSCRSALSTFFTKYERVQDREADKVTRVWPEGVKDRAVICDLDGTMCNIEHRLHTVRPPKEWGEEVALAKKEKRKNIHNWKADWQSFFYNIPDDAVNPWCADIVDKFSTSAQIVYCSGRPDDYRAETQRWLEDNDLDFHGKNLYMRHRGDHREDSIVKEILLDFEILTRFSVYFCIDDRARVVAMWRNRGYVCLQCAPGDF